MGMAKLMFLSLPGMTSSELPFIKNTPLKMKTGTLFTLPRFFAKSTFVVDVALVPCVRLTVVDTAVAPKLGTSHVHQEVLSVIFSNNLENLVMLPLRLAKRETEVAGLLQK